MANALRRHDDEFAPSEAELRQNLAAVPPAGSAQGQVASPARAAQLVNEAYRALHIGLVALPLVAGVDKFMGVLADWPQFVAPMIPDFLGVSSQSFVYGVGAFEIMLGLGLVLKTRLFADLTSAYFVAAIFNFLLARAHFEMAIAAFALAAGACGLARLAQAREYGPAFRRKDVAPPPTHGISYLD